MSGPVATILALYVFHGALCGWLVARGASDFWRTWRAVFVRAVVVPLGILAVFAGALAPFLEWIGGAP